MKWPNHGGQPETMKQLLKIDRDIDLDLSANLNPFGPPSWLAKELMEQFTTITRYPDPSYYRSELAIADYEKVGVENVLVTNGGAEAVFLVAKHFENGKAIIVQPTFLEYDRACQHYHIDVFDVYYDQQQEFQLPLSCMMERMDDIDVIFLCRPNNPTGTLVEEEQLHKLLEEGLRTRTYVVVDEAFADFLPPSQSNLTDWIKIYPNLILLRSLTKMYTIPGLRIGYILGEPSVIRKMKKEQIPWSINSLADAIIPELLNDHTFVSQTTEWLKCEIIYLRDALTDLDFYMSPTTVNFYLLRDCLQPNQTEELFHYLIQRGILTRHTHNFKGLEGNYIRVAVRSRKENDQLLTSLREWRVRT